MLNVGSRELFFDFLPTTLDFRNIPLIAASEKGIAQSLSTFSRLAVVS